MAILLLLLLTVCIIVCFYIKWHFSYWQRKGFPYVEPSIPFGCLDSVFRRERSIGLAIYDVYKSSTERVLGIYLFTRPALLIRDAQLSRDILTKEFASFHDRGIYVNEEEDPMSGGLFFLKGQKWKNLRIKLTPSFTSGKLKAMFGTVDGVSKKMLNYLNEKIPDNGSMEVEMKWTMTIYAIDIIASSMFGLDVDSFKDPKNEFFALSANVNAPNFLAVLRGTCQMMYPNLEKFFIRLGWREKAPEAMKAIVRQTIEYREKHQIERRDLLQLLLQLRNTGKINVDDEAWSAETTDSAKAMSIDMIAAQLFLFYIAGFETSASTAAFTIYELTQYPELLEKAIKDVEQAIEKHGVINYESLKDMKYLDLCVKETIRKYPALPLLNRECTHDFRIPDTNLIIKKGTPIVLSLFGMHRDPKYFPEPLRYDPERFLEENMNYNPIAYMPFGEGPRHCVAQRMGIVNVKTALATILTNFNLEISKEKREIEIDSHGIPIMPKGGIPVRISKKKTKSQ